MTANNEIPSRGEFTVGYICALFIEKAALEGMLDEVYPHLDRVQGDENSYTFGRIGDHKIVIACLPAGHVGNSPATRSATDLLRSFPSIRFGLMVGIGGGAPAGNMPSDEDIRLGDVVVSIPYGTLGGVINYNHGKLVEKGEFERTGQLNAPPVVLLNAANSLRATHERQNNLLSAHVQTMIEQTIGMQEGKTSFKDRYEYQGSKYDFLYDAGYEHQTSAPSFSYFGSRNLVLGMTAVVLIPALGVFKLQLSQSFLFVFIPLVIALLFCKRYMDSYQTVEQHPRDPKQPCLFCDKSRLVYRQPRSTPDPIIHYGTIASSDTLMKHGATRDMLRQKYKILCFEMEAAGLMNNFPCLVIRGICDYSDSHKHKIWQRYASATAAAYAKELLRAIPSVEVITMETAADALHPVLEGIDNLNTRLDPLIDEQDITARNRILTWISASTPQLEQSDRFNKHEPGTCQWFLNSDQFSTWLHTPSQTLFCPGIPGAGKSVLVSIVIDHLLKLKSNQNAAALYLYCSHDQRQTQSTHALMSSILRQLVEQQPGPIPSVVHSLYSSHEDLKSTLTLEEILNTLSQIMTAGGQVFLVVDALDECSEDTRQEFLREVQKLQAKATLSFMVTARPSVENLFPGSIRLRIEAPASDIEHYLDKHMDGLSRHVQCDPEFRQSIKQSILEVVDGMFLLAVLHLDSLKDKRTKNELRQAVERLPNGADSLKETYQAAVRRINDLRSNDREWSRRLLSFIVHATRPLRSDELLHALSTGVNSDEIDEDDCPVLDEVLERCAGLAVHNQESDTLRLVHYTTHDFLHKLDWIQERSKDVATTCTLYLMSNVFSSGPCETDEELQQRARSNPFYVYATLNWGYHIHVSALEDHDMVMQFLGKQHCVAACGQMILQARLSGKHAISWQKFFTSSKDIRPVTRQLNSLDSYGQAPLFWAVFGESVELTRLLLDNGADANIPPHHDHSVTPLGTAVSVENIELVRLLLENRADPNIPTYNDQPMTSLGRAVLKQNAELVRLLLEREADPNIPLMGSITPLRGAIHDKEFGLVTLLLQNGADPNCQLVDSMMTYLEEAVNLQIIELVALLLENGADPNIHILDSSTCLGMAIRHKSIELVRLLLKNGADPNLSPNANSMTALGEAVYYNNFEMVALLLENGANPNIPLIDSVTCLQNAIHEKRIEMVALLLNNGADPNLSRGANSMSALGEAIHSKNMEVVTLLLESRADPNAPLSDSATPLVRAVRDENIELVSLLLNHRADPNTFPSDSMAPFAMAVLEGNLELVTLLLKSGADPNTPLPDSASLLGKAIHDKNIEMVTLLLENGADPDLPLSDLLTPLEAAIVGKSIEIVSVLLKNGADPNMSLLGSTTPLGMAVFEGDVELVKLLLENGADPKAPLSDSMTTPLDLAVALEHTELEVLLSENWTIQDAHHSESPSGSSKA